MSRLAILWGIADYDKKFPNLPAVTSGLARLEHALKTELHPDYRFDVEVVSNGGVTRDGIQRRLRQFANPSPIEVLFLYLAGHGCVVDDVGYFATHGASREAPGVRFDDLARWLGDLQVSRVFVVIDCCYAGTLEEACIRRKLMCVQGSHKLATLTACRAEEIASADSAFTDAVVAGLLGARAKPDGEINWGSVALHVVEAMCASRVQTPVDNAGHLGGYRINRLPLPNTIEPSFSPSMKLPRTDGMLFGRDVELEALHRAWAHADTHIVAIVAHGGTGKSALLNRWVAQLAKKRWDGARAVFSHSFRFQGGRDDRGSSGDAFLSEALAYFGLTPGIDGPIEKATRLADQIRRQRTLFIVDGLETLVGVEGTSEGRILDLGVAELLYQLAFRMNGLCVITTRPPFSEFDSFEGETVQSIRLEHLSETDGAQLLRNLGARKGTDAEAAAASQSVAGHPLSLRLLGRYIETYLDGDVTRHPEAVLRRDGTRDGEQAAQIMSSWNGRLDRPERAIFRIIGLFDRPATPDCIQALLRDPAIPGVTDALKGVDGFRWRKAIVRLRRYGLILHGETKGQDGALDAHPLVRNYAGALLEGESREGFREAHKRIYEHLCATAADIPDSLHDLQPLYQAAMHGCRAEMHQAVWDEVFRGRIRRGAENFSSQQLGAWGADLGVLANFFSGDWTSPIEELSRDAQSDVLLESGFCLAVLGRLRDASEPLRCSAAMLQETCRWGRAARAGRALAGVYMGSGELAHALKASRLALECSERDPTEVVGMTSSRATYARVLHLVGRFDVARREFELAEEQERRGGAVIFGGLRGFQLCDLLLDLGEVRASHVRATGSLSVAQRPLERALYNLAIGQAHWATGELGDARARINIAVQEARAAAQSDEVPPILLARARILHKDGDLEAARGDLMAALHLAERYRFRLHECDAHLLDACLSLASDRSHAIDAFQRAAEIYYDCSYGRRTRELGDIAKALDLQPPVMRNIEAPLS